MAEALLKSRDAVLEYPAGVLFPQWALALMCVFWLLLTLLQLELSLLIVCNLCFLNCSVAIPSLDTFTSQSNNSIEERLCTALSVTDTISRHGCSWKHLPKSIVEFPCKNENRSSQIPWLKKKQGRLQYNPANFIYRWSFVFTDYYLAVAR